MLDKLKKSHTSQPKEATLSLEECLKANEKLKGQLTHKNDQYIRQVDKQLIEEGWTEEQRIRHFFVILPAMVKAQGEGVPARRLLGAPHAYVHELLHGDPKKAAQPTLSPDWQIAVDGGLLLGGLFALVSGTTSFFSPNQAQPMGLLTLLVNFLAGGLMMVLLSKNMPNFNAPKKGRGIARYLIVSGLLATLWVGLISLSQTGVPAAFNPKLPAIGYWLVAIAAFGGKYLFKKHYHVRGTVM